MTRTSRSPAAPAPARTRAFVERRWEQQILPALAEYIRVPAKSPLFDAEWREHGHLDRAGALVADWCRARPVPGLRVEVVRLEERTPVVLAEVPGRGAADGYAAFAALTAAGGAGRRGRAPRALRGPHRGRRGEREPDLPDALGGREARGNIKRLELLPHTPDAAVAVGGALGVEGKPAVCSTPRARQMVRLVQPSSRAPSSTVTPRARLMSCSSRHCLES